jgi:catechol 2,3-dioxygenase-like lactoylglutathione lyase family enzyme
MTAKNIPINKQLTGINHVGITVENMSKALEFYIEVLGGKLIFANESISGQLMQNTLFQKEELDSLALKKDLNALAVPDLRSGTHNLDVYFVQFENLIIELLQYRDAHLPPKGSQPFPAKHSIESPAFLNSMHISFYVKSDVDMDAFAAQIEEECHRRNMPKVVCNRIVRVNSNEERKKVDPSNNSCKFSEKFEGFSMFYCKGPNGEQLEFNQVRNKAHELFAQSQHNFYR